MKMDQKVALVTGSATGVGKACALSFARLGYAVGVNYSRSEAEAKETAKEIESLGVPCLLLRCNVGKETEVRKMIEEITTKFGGLDVLVNNAAMTYFVDHQNLDGLTDQVWDDIFQVNLKGTFYCIRAALPWLKERKGNVVNISSVAGLQGHGSSIPYAASKAAVNCMTQSLARSLAPNVRVNAVAPGPILTRWLEGREEMVQKSLAHTPLQRAAYPEDIAEVVIFLATQASLMTGQVVVIDGGRTM